MLFKRLTWIIFHSYQSHKMDCKNEEVMCIIKKVHKKPDDKEKRGRLKTRIFNKNEYQPIQ